VEVVAVQGAFVGGGGNDDVEASPGAQDQLGEELVGAGRQAGDAPQVPGRRRVRDLGPEPAVDERARRFRDVLVTRDPEPRQMRFSFTSRQ
jgi:hypothetical protein